jgi:hypothetical protein
MLVRCTGACLALAWCSHPRLVLASAVPRVLALHGLLKRKRKRKTSRTLVGWLSAHGFALSAQPSWEATHGMATGCTCRARSPVALWWLADGKVWPTSTSGAPRWRWAMWWSAGLT